MEPVGESNRQQFPLRMPDHVSAPAVQSPDQNSNHRCGRLETAGGDGPVNDAWSVSVLETPADHARIHDEILELYRKVGSPWSPVAHPTWVQSWWLTRTPDTQMRCFIARHDGQLAVCIPMEFGVQRFSGLPAVQKAMTSNLSWGWTSSLVDPERSSEWVVPFSRWLDGGSPRWTVLEMGSFPAHAPEVPALIGAIAAHQWHVESFQRNMAVLDLPATMDDYLADAGQHLRHNNRHVRAVCAQAGITTEVHWHADWDDIRTHVGSVSRRSWQGRQHSAVYLDHSSFYERLSLAGTEFALGLIDVVDPHHQPLAYMLTAHVGEVIHAIDTGFDPDAAEFSPGTLAFLVTIEEAIDMGARRLDFGEAAPYKRRFKTHDEPGVQIRATRAGTALWARVVHRARA
jgi:hypothetical protein